MRHRILLVALLVALGACAEGFVLVTPPTTAAPPATAAVAATTVPASTSTTLRMPDLRGRARGWEMSLRAVGPFTIGMPVADAEATVGVPLFEMEDGDPACSTYRFHEGTGIRDELSFLVRAGTIARIDVDGALVRTLSGLGVGDADGAIVSTYGGNVVRSSPPEGQQADSYLTYIADDEADLDFRIRFEIRDGVVTTFRVGVVPEVEWVDRCGR